MADFNQNLDLLSQEEEKLQVPKRYTVMFHNDSYTTMEFVVWVVMKVFKTSQEDAHRFMLRVHQSGKGAIGNFSYDIANTKSNEVMAYARQSGFPLLCTVEELPNES
jgi:ATP-dependent Clp protease adaptor protein ClpS